MPLDGAGRTALLPRSLFAQFAKAWEQGAGQPRGLRSGGHARSGPQIDVSVYKVAAETDGINGGEADDVANRGPLRQEVDGSLFVRIEANLLGCRYRSVNIDQWRIWQDMRNDFVSNLGCNKYGEPW